MSSETGTVAGVEFTVFEDSGDERAEPRGPPRRRPGEVVVEREGRAQLVVVEQVRQPRPLLGERQRQERRLDRRSPSVVRPAVDRGRELVELEVGIGHGLVDVVLDRAGEAEVRAVRLDLRPQLGDLGAAATGHCGSRYRRSAALTLRPRVRRAKMTAAAGVGGRRRHREGPLMATPLDGIKVLDLCRVLAGPHAGRLLADLGADVVKVEPPEGDVSRQFGKKPESAYFRQQNAGKRSITVDLTTAEGRDVVRRLAARADVVTENFRPGIMARFGLAYDDLVQVNPRLVMLSISGLRPGGPGA